MEHSELPQSKVHLDYAERVKAELKNYEAALEQGGLSHSIPQIFGYWAAKSLSPRLLNIFGVTDISELFASELSLSPSTHIPCVFPTLGSGDCRTEIEIANFLINDNIKPIFVCLEINEAVVNKARELISDAGLDRFF